MSRATPPSRGCIPRLVRTFFPPPPPRLPLQAQASRGSAFTLVELMVATAITSLLLLGMTGIFDQSMKAWRISSRRADAEREVRAALATIQRDLRGLVVNSNYPILFNVVDAGRVSIPSGLLVNMPARAGPEGQDWSDVSGVLFFSSLQRETGGTGDVAGIGYFVAWDASANEGRGGYNLYRRYQRPVDLLRGIQTFMNDPSTGPYHTNSIALPEVIGANVLNFWSFMAGISSASNTPFASLTYGNIVNGVSLTNRPSYVQLELTAYGSEAVRNFGNRAEWGATNNIQKFGRSYIWRVDL